MNPRVSTDSNGTAKSLGLNAQPEVESDEIIAAIAYHLLRTG